MKINKQKLKYRIMAVIVTLSILLSYMAVFIVDSFAYSGTSTLVPFGVLDGDVRNTQGKVVRGNMTVFVTSKWLETYNMQKDICVYVTSSVDKSGTTRYGLSVLMNGVKDNDIDTHSFIQSEYEDLSAVNDFGSITNLYGYSMKVYVFTDLQMAKKYIAGNMSAEELQECATNYDEVQELLAGYDSSIPVPVKANVNVITASTVSSVFEYNEDELKSFEEENNVELQYEYEVEYFYQLLSKSQVNNQNSNLEVAEINRGVDDFALDKNNLFVAKITCKEQFEAFQVGGTPTTQKYLCTADSGTYKTTGIVELNNAVTSSPPDYYTLYTIPFSVFSMEYHMQFIAAQVRVTTYYVDDSGVKHKSDDVYFRRCLWSKDNDHYGATYTRIAKDDNGDDVFKNSYEMNSNGDDIGSDLGNIDDGNILQHIKNGFGLTGSDGYIELSNRFFSTVPSGVWSIIMYALAVSVVIIIFKSLRGM